ncbi:TonB-dependent receptor [Flavicella sediminum]|uniref:TonB-dependent receptor n=1 Tax=Flavicella sediminum TaxID=2585141 RepID=UPI001122FD87|nr:TonB-dependent receptor [Flavicella sediminum]
MKKLIKLRGKIYALLRRNLTMKLTVFLFLLSLFQIHATSYSQKTKITLSLENVTVEEALNQIEARSEFNFFYSDEEIDYKRQVSVRVDKKLIFDILDSLFKNTAVVYEVVDRNIVLKLDTNILATLEAEEQQKTISGTVHDEVGMPLPGASVIAEGSTTGATTDFDGNFTINVSESTTNLLISYVGFKTQSITITNKTSVKVVLQPDAASLEEVVIVGYGTQKKESITGSIATVKSEVLTSVPSTNTSAMLAGRLPGLVVTQNNGQPGGDQANISIRGFGNALVIVDGVPRDYQQLDPNEIESISILKDASAAVYGARAGNGVVLVTTKRGKVGAPEISYSGSVTFQQPTFLPKLASASSFAKYQQQAELLEGVAVADLTYSDEAIAKYKAATEEGYKGTDWQDVVLKDWATTEQHNFNVRGGTEKVKYFTSIGKLEQNSLLESGDGKFERFNVGATIDAEINSRLDIGVNLKYREEETGRPSGISGDNDSYMRIFRFLASMNPTIQQNPDPSLLTAAHPLESNAVAYSTSAITGINDTKRKQFDAVLNFKYKLPYIEGLNVNGTLAHQTVNSLNRLTRVPFTTYHHNFETGENTEGFTTAENLVSSWSNNYSQTTTQIGLDYKGSFNDHNLAGALILENRYIDNYAFNASRTNLLSSDIPYLFAATGTQENGDSVSENGRKGVVARVNYDYMNKYLIEGLFRADANIQFPEAKRWGYFPGVSLGWLLSKEKFLEDSPVIDFLKLRTSFASLGFDGTSSFDYLSGFGLQNGRANTYAYGTTGVNTSLRTIGLANPNITWETMKTYNLGVDANMWNSQLGVEFDVFYRKRSGLLRNRLQQFPDTFGANLPQENLGIRNNRGFELVLTHKNSIGDLNYNISGNVTWTREKIVDNVEREFDAEEPDDARINQQNGQWANRRFGYRTDGFYDTQEEIDNDGITYDPSIGEASLGDVKYVDKNKDGNIDWRDQELIGRGQTPELFFGLGVNADYKGFDFSMLLQGASNFDVLASTGELGANTSIGQVPFQYQVDNAWSADNPSVAKLPAPNTSGLNIHNNQVLDIYVRNGAYLRLKSITLGYSIPKKFLSKVGLKNARLYVSGYNLFTFRTSSIFDLDPEARGNDGVATYPVQRNISLGVNIGL